MDEVQTNEIIVRAIQTRRIEPGYSAVYEEGTLVTARSNDELLVSIYVRETSIGSMSYSWRVRKVVKRTLKIAQEIKGNQGVLKHRKLHPWWKFWKRSTSRRSYCG